MLISALADLEAWFHGTEVGRVFGLIEYFEAEAKLRIEVCVNANRVRAEQWAQLFETPNFDELITRMEVLGQRLGKITEHEREQFRVG